MDSYIKSRLKEFSQSLAKRHAQATANIQSIELRIETIDKTQMEMLKFLNETLKKEVEAFPFIAPISNLMSLKKNLNDLVDERRARINVALEAKQEKRIAKDDSSNKLHLLKKDIETLMEENHIIEEKLKPEENNLPLILKLMRSLSSVPKSAISSDIRDENDTITRETAKHLESLLDKVEDT